MTCKNCGAPVVGGTCEYCGTEYYPKGRYDAGSGEFFTSRPKEGVIPLQSDWKVSYEYMAKDQDALFREIKRELSFNLAKAILPYIDIKKSVCDSNPFLSKRYL